MSQDTTQISEELAKTPITEDHVMFAQSALNYFQQTAHSVATQMTASMAEMRREARDNPSPAARKEAKEALMRQDATIAAYNALITMAGDIIESLPKFEGAKLEDVCGEVQGAEDVEEEGGKIYVPEG